MIDGVLLFASNKSRKSKTRERSRLEEKPTQKRGKNESVKLLPKDNIVFKRGIKI